MKGYVEAVTAALILFILGVAFTATFLGRSATKDPLDEDAGLTPKGCTSEDDCTENLDGLRCLLIWQQETSRTCGCVYNEDCDGRRSGLCGTGNKCV